MDTRLIPLDQIMEPPEPVRVSMDEAKLFELRDSMRALGQLQAIIVVPVPSGNGESGYEPQSELAAGDPTHSPRYEIVAGHRRYLAARLVPLKELRCDVYDSAWDGKLAAMIAENAFREDVTAAEEGWKYLAFIEKFNPTEAHLCSMFQQSPEYIYSRIDMCRKDANIATLVAQRKIRFSVAKELLKCPDEQHRAYLAHLCAESGATVNVARNYVAQWKAQQQGTVELQTVTSVTDAGTPPVENTIKCWCCGGEKDPQNLRLIYVHWYELDTWLRILTEAGLRSDARPAGAGA